MFSKLRRSVFVLMPSESDCMRGKTYLSVAVFWFAEVDFSDDGGSRHRNVLECSLYKKYLESFYVHIVGSVFR